MQIKQKIKHKPIRALWKHNTQQASCETQRRPLSPEEEEEVRHDRFKGQDGLAVTARVPNEKPTLSDWN